MEVDVHIARMSFEIDIGNVNNHLAQLKQDLTKRKNMGHRVNKISKWQEELHRTVNQAAAQERRRKRNLLAWLASIGGLFNTMKIHQVKGTVDNVIDASTKVVHEVDVIQQHIMTQDKNVKLLAQELRTEQANTWDMSKRIEINLKWEEMERLITVLRNIIEKLNNHKLAHEMTEIFDMQQEWMHLKQKAEAKNKQLVIAEWQELFQLPSSFWVQDKKILVAIEIPTKEPGTPVYDLMSIRPCPIPWGDKYYLAEPLHSIIAVNRVSGATLALTQNQVNEQCTWLRGTCFFQGAKLEAHGSPKTCIHALWTAQANEIQEWCHLTVRLPREMAFAINQTTAVWLVAKPTRITITCKRRTTMTKMMNTTTAIQLPKGCKAATEAFSFSPGEKESNTISTVARMVTDATNTTYEWNHKSWQLQRPQQIVRKGEEIRRMLDNARPPLIPVWVAVVLAIIALVAVLLFMGWLYITARRQWNLGTVVTKNERSEADEKDT